ncbi:hypothetical protein KXV95_008907 [Aspergillus fumigatus]|nr:hypothetical protein CNMCM8714_008744 [Aspergillus fumigatus]KAF4274517.1 hypothetical protein CNMCM8812_005023 [Aspergillus fumigatus]KAH1303297.1 hypothetical protein KXX11_002175 [Aspergillus fumigatus]KAH1408867.1 hypothetical protein KXX51_005641 [Aspergillus fumigatus]KAH1420612.1 hypothetical protein KXX22_003964 [Aspergillus fumigatus]
MADPIADAPVIDEFAQTRGGDDLFDDEIIPVSADEQVQAEVQTPEENVADTKSQEPPRIDTPPRSRGADRRGGRGRGRGRGGRGSHHSGRGRAEGGPRGRSTDNAAEREDNKVENAARDTPAEGSEQSAKEDETKADAKPAAAANGTEAQRVPAVRGDRSATGGVKKPKLTEEELTRRIAAAKENAAKKAAAYARAEADQASFLEREKIAEEKRLQERQNRRAMDSERERNRLRKLEALGGREWDATKREEDYNPRGGRGQFRRGMHGGVSGYVRRDFDDARTEEDQEGRHHLNHRGRGRGGRGGRGRGASRAAPFDGASDEAAAAASPAPPVLNNEQEFPALPGGHKPTDKTVSDLADKLETSLSPVSGATWAEQVESQRD